MVMGENVAAWWDPCSFRPNSGQNGLNSGEVKRCGPPCHIGAIKAPSQPPLLSAAGGSLSPSPPRWRTPACTAASFGTTTPTPTGISAEHLSDSECPPHPGFLKGICVRCGKLEADDRSGLALSYIHKVWHQHKENLILMERYHYFSSSCRQFGFSAKSLSESKRDERKSDGALANILNILKQAHKMFFDPDLGNDLSSRDVRQMLNKIRQETLEGCKIVFSRVFRTNSVAKDQSIWKMAEQLGATCVTEVDSSVTHIVSTDMGTQKARWTIQNEKFLVNPGWIEAANYLWRRQPENHFAVNRPKNT